MMMFIVILVILVILRFLLIHSLERRPDVTSEQVMVGLNTPVEETDLPEATT